MKRFELVIAGGGLTAARAIKSYREAGGGGAIALRTAESVLPDHRPALSKRYLRGETGAPFVEDETFYRDHDVDVLLGTPVTGVDPASRSVTTEQGPLHYEQLLIATGASPRRLNVPGADLEGVYPLRTLDDSDRIRDAARGSRQAAVIGGGFIGMEVTASLRQLGLEVTQIHLGNGLFDQLRSPGLSDELLALYREQGVEVLLEHEVSRFGGDGRFEWLECTNGHCVAADLVVVGAGVIPNTAFLEGSGITLENGVVVDERFETNVPGVYAAGDVANFYDPLYGRRRRIEHWSNANYQGTEVGKILAGQGASYDTVSSFFSEVFGLTIKVLGDVSRFDESRADGGLDAGLLVGYGENGRLVGALLVGQSEEVELRAGELIAGAGPADALHVDLVGSGRS